MKSIYSITVLQRIIDHWGIGRIQDVTYFEQIGRQIWRHFIVTPQGEFELYSYPPENDEYSTKRIVEFTSHHNFAPLHTLIVHSFDRYHRLEQRTKKIPVHYNQITLDFEHIKSLKILKAYRVFGSIFQLHLEDESVLVSYGYWKITKTDGETTVETVNSEIHSKSEMDEAIEQLLADQLKILDQKMDDKWFIITLSEHTYLHFKRSAEFPALEMQIKDKRNRILLFDKDEIYYSRDMRK